MGMLCFWLAASCAACAAPRRPGTDFVGITDFSRFHRESTESGQVLTSPAIASRIAWNELIVSWNTIPSTNSGLRLEARGVYPGRTTRFYTLALWAPEGSTHPRQSVNGQEDNDGKVLTDTLVLNRPGARAQLRVTLSAPPDEALPGLKFLGLAFCDTRVEPVPRPPRRAAWGRSIAVPERSQFAFPGGEVWCSPASTSMVLAYWGNRLDRTEMILAVPEAAQAVFDPNWPGTGNWPFNTALAGSFDGFRAYVARLETLRDLGEWILRGVPVVASISYNVLKGRERVPGDGHLIVCVGFTKEGDLVVNDPGVGEQVRRVYPRAAFERAWAFSHRTVYLIHPESIRFHGTRRR